MLEAWVAVNIGEWLQWVDLSRSAELASCAKSGERSFLQRLNDRQGRENRDDNRGLQGEPAPVPPVGVDAGAKRGRFAMPNARVKMWFISDRWRIADDLPGRRTMSAYGFAIGSARR